MTDYIRLVETSSKEKADSYIKKGWDLIDTSKAINYESDCSYLKYHLGLSSIKYANKLLAIIKEYEKYGFKEALLEKVGKEIGDKIENYQASTCFPALETPLAKYAANYEDVVNNEEIFYLKKEKHGAAFNAVNIESLSV